jgi:hypothetical protein
MIVQKAESRAHQGRLVCSFRSMPWAVVFWAVLFCGGLIASLLLTKESELPVYVLAAERIVRGEPIYQDEARAFTYPPLFALPCVPLVWLPEAARRPVWYSINFAALLVIGLLLRRRLQSVWAEGTIGRGPAPWVFWGLVVVMVGRHIVTVLERGSHDLLVFLCTFLAIDALCIGRSKTAGLWAGLGAALKATPLLFAPVLLWQRRFVAVTCLALALLTGLFLPDLLCPAKDGTFWTVGWHRTFLTAIKPGESAASSAWNPWWSLNQSLAGTIHRLFTHPGPDNHDEFDVILFDLGPAGLRVVTLAGQLAVAAWLFWVTRPKLSRHQPAGEQAIARLGEGAAVLTAMVLLSPTSIKNHFCVMLVPITFCLADFLYRRRDPIVGAALAVVFVLGTLTVKAIIPRGAADWLLAAGSQTWCAVALYLATGRILLQRACLVEESARLPNSILSPEWAARLRAA